MSWKKDLVNKLIENDCPSTIEELLPGISEYGCAMAKNNCTLCWKKSTEGIRKDDI